jgi:hypothetical protein
MIARLRPHIKAVETGFFLSDFHFIHTKSLTISKEYYTI